MIVIIGFFICSFIKKSKLAFIIFYGGFHGIGDGFGYMAPVQCAWKYYPNWKGLAGGIIISAFGVGAFIFSQIATLIINPHNLEPNISVK